jgi:transposase
MPRKKYLVTLSDTERAELEQLLRRGQHPSRKLTRARILLKAAAGERDQAIVQVLGVGHVSVERVRQRYVERALACLHDSPRPGQTPRLDAKGEARLIAEACRTAPAGREHWTLQLLAERVVALGLADSYAHESVRQVLKKTRSSRG